MNIINNLFVTKSIAYYYMSQQKIYYFFDVCTVHLTQDNTINITYLIQIRFRKHAIYKLL